jgi:inosine/xanthosine triphosphatase
MLNAIGSTNPVKINAVKQALKSIYPSAEFKSTEIKSGVNKQPKSDAETRKGAIYRAKKALIVHKANLGIGIEGGVIETEYGMMSTAWAVIVDNNHHISFGGGLHFHLPEIVAQRIRGGEELGPIMDSLTGIKNSKQKGGAVEIFTKGLVSRTMAYQRLVELALTKFIAKEWFD